MKVIGVTAMRKDLGKTRHTFKCNSNMDLVEIGSGVTVWIVLAQDREQ
jgi:hypothetical protein